MKKMYFLFLLIATAPVQAYRDMKNTCERWKREWKQTYSIESMDETSRQTLASCLFYLQDESPLEGEDTVSRAINSFSSTISKRNLHRDCYNAIVKVHENSELASFAAKSVADKEKCWKESIGAYYEEVVHSLKTKNPIISFGAHQGEPLPANIKPIHCDENLYTSGGNPLQPKTIYTMRTLSHFDDPQPLTLNVWLQVSLI